MPIYKKCLNCDAEFGVDPYREKTAKFCSMSCTCQYRKPATKHGFSKIEKYSGTYNSWMRMRARCAQINNPKYHRYGGRGISVCKRWDDFSLFLDDMGIKPDGKSLDRIDNDGDYTPENCRWATDRQQSRNRSTTKLNENLARIIRSYRHIGLTVPEISKKTGFKQCAISDVVLGRSWVGV